jgi:plastocyanin
MKKLIASKSRLLIGAGFLFAILCFSSGCSKSSSSNNATNPGANEVWIESGAFNPATITVNAGTTITWTNKDVTAHTVTSDKSGDFDSGTINVNGTYPRLFPTAGSFPYHCTIHPTMTARVVVN